MGSTERAGAGAGAGSAAALLVYVSILLAGYGGAMLATGARLKWDPTTYVPLRELLPELYRALAGLLPAAAAALLLLPAAAAAALAARRARTRRTLWLIYAVSTGVLLAVEVCAGVWAARQVAAWLRSEAARQLQDTLELREHLLPLLAALERWHPLPARVKEILQEAEEDAPRNGYCAGAALGGLLAAQLAALVLAVRARAQEPRTPTRPRPPLPTISDRGTSNVSAAHQLRQARPCPRAEAGAGGAPSARRPASWRASAPRAADDGRRGRRAQAAGGGTPSSPGESLRPVTPP